MNAKMNAKMNASIRRFQLGDEPALFRVFHSAVHTIASEHYTEAEVNAWAPDDLDPEAWATRIRGIDPFVAEVDGVIVGYADVQKTGYIDHFFVSGSHSRMGIGSALMDALHQEAGRLALPEIWSHVSRAAQPFFAGVGFQKVEDRVTKVRGVELSHAFMRKGLRPT